MQGVSRTNEPFRNDTMRTQAKELLGSIQQLAVTWVMTLAIMVGSLLTILPASAQATEHSLNTLALGTMANKARAEAKKTEGKLESAYGEITGNTGHQIKGKAKQVQGSAMGAAEDVRKGAETVAKNVADAAGNLGK